MPFPPQGISPHPENRWTVLPSGSLQPRPPGHPPGPPPTQRADPLCCPPGSSSRVVWAFRGGQGPPGRQWHASRAHGPAGSPGPQALKVRTSDLSEGTGPCSLPRTPPGADSAPWSWGRGCLSGPQDWCLELGTAFGVHSYWLSPGEGDTGWCPGGLGAPALLTQPCLLSVPRRRQ